MKNKKPSPEKATQENKISKDTDKSTSKEMPEEFGGTKGLEPTRYGDWEHGGRCTDF